MRPPPVRPKNSTLLPDGLGYLEYDLERAQLLFRDAQGQPLPDVTDVTLTIGTNDGPRELTLEACANSTSAAGCWAMPAKPLPDADVTGVVRFTHEGRRYRAILPQPQASTAPTQPSTAPGAR
jgi:hypothetical protein